MNKESFFIMNDIEKQLAEDLIQKLAAGELPPKKLTTKANDLNYEISYEYRSNKQEQTVQGEILSCRDKLKHRGKGRVFFSAVDCTDVCGVFYDMYMLTYAMNQGDFHIRERHAPLVPDMNTDRYVFCTDKTAASFLEMAVYLRTLKEKALYNSQYIFSLFEEPKEGDYNALIASLKASGYSSVQVIEIWIRSEILYYALADGTVLRPEHQRAFTRKEEADITRKIEKSVNDRFKHVNLADESIYS
jgi:hypothetical protein